MIPFIISLIAMLIFAVLSVPGLAVLFVVRLFSERAAMNASRSIIGFMGRVLYGISGSRVTLKGLENIKKGETYLFVSNHRSIFDAVGGFAFTPGHLCFVAKKESARIPVVSIYMKLAGCLFIDRQDIRQGFQTIMSSIDRVKSGTSVWICPEGTRNRGSDHTELLDFHDGSFKIASKGSVRVVPVAITGTAEIFETHIPLIKPSRVIFHYGVPVDMETLEAEDRKRPGAYFRAVITGMLKTDRE